jgi:isoleucyl-tRNA synthetase
MPFAQFHYPFSTSKDEFMKKFPADFIAEGIDQTRGWYYTLNVISTIVTHQNPFKNLIVHGLVLAQDGKKMSKRLHNYPDPMHIANKYGVDAVRMYMISSPVVRGENLKFNEKGRNNLNIEISGINAIVRDVFLPWYNAYRFLIQNITRWELQTKKQFEFDSNIKSTLNAESNTMDKWIIAANQNLIRFVRKEMENYRLYTIIPKLLKFLEDLTNWYVRLNRNRIKGMTDEEDWRYCINVLFDVLLSTTTLMAPYTPFITELIYQNLRKGIPKGTNLVP